MIEPNRLDQESKFRVLCDVARISGARNLIEVGTFRGEMARRCASIFNVVWTIELDHELAERATASLRDLTHVTVFEGSGLVWLPDLFENYGAAFQLVFLDGHYSGAGTALGPDAEPAVKELDVLLPFARSIRAIVVDDFRCLGVNDGFPKKWELLRAAEEKWQEIGYQVIVQNDQVIIVKEAT
jgi:hypothetical protein